MNKVFGFGAAALLAAGLAFAGANGDVVINEYTVNVGGTATDGSSSEYVELLTITNNVNIAGWTLSDRSSTGATGTTEGDITFPNAAPWTSLPAGTHIAIYLAVPTAPSTLVEDLNASDRTIKVKSTTLTAAGTLDVSTNENLILWDGAHLGSNVIDYVATGTNTSAAGFTGTPITDWSANTAAGATDQVGYFVPASTATVNDFKVNHPGSVWVLSTTPGDRTPGTANPTVNESVFGSSVTDWAMFN